ncbi:hypothetical protein PNE09_07485 [[Eubacterium] siraeum]|uniref:Uncharacterized protein n=1 Tax=[Eubacterium] siraeum TaxID=39492 RepID=A0AAW6D134_9FIRM|nr:hypothetical protein [[Eubacterium] siraeum]MDB8003908.1 hypothetical protein [[Eubacterium] siraeum]
MSLKAVSAILRDIIIRRAVYSPARIYRLTGLCGYAAKTAY